MLRRVFRLFLFQLLGAVVGYMLWPSATYMQGLIAGIVGASWVWLMIDLRRGHKLRRWLRTGDTASPPRIPGYWGEITDRVRRLLRDRDRLLRDSDARLQEFLSAIQASPNGVVLLDAEGRIEWCNQTAAEHFGFDARRDVLQLIGNLVRDPAFAAYQAAGDFTHDVVMPGPGSSSSRPVRLSVHLHPYGEGRALMMSRDVTALEQADAMRRDFVANVSHEIRTPLTVLGGFVETMQNLPLDASERQRYLSLMSQQAERMQSLVRDLLTLSRLEGSPPPRTDEWIDVRGLIAQCEEEGRELSMLMSEMGHNLQVEITGDSEIAGSPVELHSAMANLVNNAIRYTPTGGKVVVRWRVLEDGNGEFSVTDTGPGIAPEHLPRLTERFYRIDRSRSRETGGTGLGLAIVKHVAQRHAGSLTIDSTPGHGSCFAITLPANRVRAVQALKAAA
jgi:two-component system, OmpR family, phosphate regulon sensor histidine kinase PhoR